MNPGYVYLFTNAAMPGLIKIGCSQRDRRVRARELYTTGVPLPFDIAFELFSEDHKVLEDRMKTELAAFRVNPVREFFRYPLKDAINILLKLNEPVLQTAALFNAIRIFDRLKEKYPAWINADIVDIQIVQTHERVWLEVTKEIEVGQYLKDQIITRTDLAFIHDSVRDGDWFLPGRSVVESAARFTEELDAYSLLAVTDIFNKEASDEIEQLEGN